MNIKGALPEKFQGRAEDSFRAWSHDLKAYCNATYKGFRRALVWAESQDQAIDDAAMALVVLKPMNSANSELYDLLVTVTMGEAKNMVLNVLG